MNSSDISSPESDEPNTILGALYVQDHVESFNNQPTNPLSTNELTRSTVDQDEETNLVVKPVKDGVQLPLYPDDGWKGFLSNQILEESLKNIDSYQKFCRDDCISSYREDQTEVEDSQEDVREGKDQQSQKRKGHRESLFDFALDHLSMI